MPYLVNYKKKYLGETVVKESCLGNNTIIFSIILGHLICINSFILKLTFLKGSNCKKGKRIHVYDCHFCSVLTVLLFCINRFKIVRRCSLF